MGHGLAFGFGVHEHDASQFDDLFIRPHGANGRHSAHRGGGVSTARDGDAQSVVLTQAQKMHVFVGKLFVSERQGIVRLAQIEIAAVRWAFLHTDRRDKVRRSELVQRLATDLAHRVQSAADLHGQIQVRVERRLPWRRT